MPDLDLNDLRRRYLEGEEIPLETMREVVVALRAGRKSSAESPAAVRRAAAKPSVDGDALLDSL